jgi:hypothetical protein
VYPSLPYLLFLIRWIFANICAHYIFSKLCYFQDVFTLSSCSWSTLCHRQSSHSDWWSSNSDWWSSNSDWWSCNSHSMYVKTNKIYSKLFKFTQSEIVNIIVTLSHYNFRSKLNFYILKTVSSMTDWQS